LLGLLFMAAFGASSSAPFPGDSVTYISADNSDIRDGMASALENKKSGLLVDRIRQQLVQPESTARLIEQIGMFLEAVAWPGVTVALT
jgi:hypothetical protein